MQLFRLYLTVSSLLILPVPDVLAQQQELILESAGRFDGAFAPAVHQGRKVLLHQSGAIVVDKAEERIRNGGSIARKGGFAGAIDSSGKVIVPFAYDEVEEHDDFHFFILKKNGKYGLADSTGRILAEPQFDSVEGLSARAAGFKRGNQYGWVNLHNGQSHPSPHRLSKSYIGEHLFEMRQGDLKGLFHERKGEIFPVRYEMIYRAYPGTVVVQEKEKCVLMTEEGATLAQPAYDHLAWDWDDSLLRARQNGKVGLMNAGGRLTVPVIYNELKRFNGGQAVAVQNGKAGVVDTSGRVIVPLVYDEVVTTDALGRELLNYAEKVIAEDPFRAYKVRKGDRYGLLSWSGRELLPAVYGWITVATVNGRAYCFVQKGKKNGLFTREGKQLIPPVYDELTPAGKSNSGFTYYATDAARPAADQMIRAENDGRTGLFDLNGQVVVPVRYESLRWESNGLLELKSGDTTAIADAKGNMVRPPKRSAYYTMVAMDRIAESTENGYRLTDLAGNLVYQLGEWEQNRSRNGIGDSSYFYDGLMKVGGYNQRNLFITRDGKEVRFDGYDEVGVFFDGLAYAEKGQKAGFINPAGREVIAVEWDDIRNLTSGDNQYKRVRKNEKAGLVHRSGKLLLPAEYDRIGSIGGGYFTFTKNDRTGLADSTGRIVLQPEYSDISLNTSVSALVLQKDSKQGLATLRGEVIIPAEYDGLAFNYGWDAKGWPILARQGNVVRYFSNNGRALPVKAAKMLAQ